MSYRMIRGIPKCQQTIQESFPLERWSTSVKTIHRASGQEESSQLQILVESSADLTKKQQTLLLEHMWQNPAVGKANPSNHFVTKVCWSIKETIVQILSRKTHEWASQRAWTTTKPRNLQENLQSTKSTTKEWILS
jgi:hypothetical protein